MPSPARTRPGRPILLATATLLPWGWFLVRNLGWLTEPIAVAFPLIGGVLVLLLGITGIVARRVGPVAVAGSLLLLTTVVTIAPRIPAPSPVPRAGVRILSANVYQLNREPAAAAAALAATDADVVIAVETPDGFGALLGARDATRPFSADTPQITMRSRFPLESAPMSSYLPRGRVLRAIVRAPSGPFVVYAVHALNPAYESTFAEQLDFIDRLRRAALAETLPVVIAGDFNMSDRQLGYRNMVGSFRDASRAGWAADTYDHGVWRALLLRIDYLFVDPSWCAADSLRIAVPGSDHEAVEATVGPCPG
jgi:endonuclease/exonuclease/phosphatase (EEP) superfamily protein YafD